MRSTLALTFLTASVLACNLQATVIYSDLATFSGLGYQSGGAAKVGGDNITTTIADDINVTAGGSVDALRFSVVNFDSTSVTFRPIVSIWAADGSGGGPGTLLASFNLDNQTQAATNSRQ